MGNPGMHKGLHDTVGSAFWLGIFDAIPWRLPLIAEDGFEPPHSDHETNKLTITLFREDFLTPILPV